MSRHEDPEATKPKGRPRSQTVDTTIIEATLDLIAELGSFESVTVDAIAARAGVGKATIYRRWPHKEAVIVEAIKRMRGTLPVLKGDNIRDDLLTLARSAQQTEDTRESRVFASLAPELRRNPELTDLYEKSIDRRKEAVRQALRDGIDRGEVRPDIDIELTNAMLIGPILMITSFGMYRSIPRQGLVERIVDQLLVGITTN